MANSAAVTTGSPAEGQPWVPEWNLADRLRKARQATKLGQREFAEQLGVTAGAYQQWEASMSRPRNPVAMAKRIELLTGVSATWLLGLEEERPRPITPAGANARPEGFEPPTFWSGTDIHKRDEEEPRPVTSLDEVRRRKSA